MDADEIEQGRERWQRATTPPASADADFTTLSGVEVDPVYGPRPGRRRRGLRADRLAGGVPVHPRAVPDRLPRPDLDDPPVRRLRQRRSRPTSATR